MPQATLRCGAEWRCRCCDGAAALAEHEESASLLRHRADRQGGVACSAAVRSRARARVGRRRRWRVPMIDTRPVGLRCALSLSLVCADPTALGGVMPPMRCDARSGGRAGRLRVRPCSGDVGPCRALPTARGWPARAHSSRSRQCCLLAATRRGGRLLLWRRSVGPQAASQRWRRLERSKPRVIAQVE